jgi:hypothetical protein
VVVDVVAAQTSDFVQRLEASVWQVELPGIAPEEAMRAASRFLAEPEVIVERLTKNGVRRFDARGAVLHVDGAGIEPDCAILTLVVRHGTPSVRPDDVLLALRRVADLVPPKPPRVTRLAQGPLDEAGTSVTDPLGPDRPN